MIGGISSAFSGVTVAAARFDRAAVAVTDAAASESDAGPDVGDVGGAMAAMIAARFGLLASLQVARTSSEMIAQTLGAYGIGEPR